MLNQSFTCFTSISERLKKHLRDCELSAPLEMLKECDNAEMRTRAIALQEQLLRMNDWKTKLNWMTKSNWFTRSLALPMPTIVFSIIPKSCANFFYDQIINLIHGSQNVFYLLRNIFSIDVCIALINSPRYTQTYLENLKLIAKIFQLFSYNSSKRFLN